MGDYLEKCLQEHEDRRQRLWLSGYSSTEMEVTAKRSLPPSGRVEQPVEVEEPTPPLRKTKDTRSLTQKIIDTTAEFYGLNSNQIKSHVKTGNMAHARQVAMYFCRKLTKRTLSELGMSFHRDHTTVLYGIDCVKKQISVDNSIAEEIAAVRARIDSVLMGVPGFAD